MPHTLETVKLGEISVAGTIESRTGTLAVTSAAAPTMVGTHAGRWPIAANLSRVVRSSTVRRALILIFATSVGLIWVGAVVSILHELIGWWAALEYAGLTATTPWPQR